MLVLTTLAVSINTKGNRTIFWRRKPMYSQPQEALVSNSPMVSRASLVNSDLMSVFRLVEKDAKVSWAIKLAVRWKTGA